MLTISKDDIAYRIARDNPWWTDAEVGILEFELPKRHYFEPFSNLALDRSIRRAAVLLGPRRVGKTVMVKQIVPDAIAAGFPRNNILYASIDAPVYAGIGLEKLVGFLKPDPGPKLVIFDEIQYLKNWEVHLKDLVDSFPDVKFVATGSAAAALKLKSRESGAGRFSEFILPPLTFHEFLEFSGKASLIGDKDGAWFTTPDIESLNAQFIDYLNFGGYPEAVFNATVRSNADQFIKNDIIDKVLLKDLPSLYGINDIQELNRLFSVIAFNTGQEINLETISQQSGITKPTIKKYIEYLESAFLVLKVSMISDTAKSMQRERHFKLYLNNPSMRAALFSPTFAEESDKVGHLVESAIFAQWQHAPDFNDLKYARWKGGEVDVVYMPNGYKNPEWAGEVKWSDRVVRKEKEVVRNLAHLIRKHPDIEDIFLTTKTTSGTLEVEGHKVSMIPCAIYCYTVGRNVMSGRLSGAF
ncbi:MAG: ATP-binding protein [Alphaproteobacteria bacterium]|nr:ATP-binding protein [Alphaproteobacteria bacterium]MBO6862326.1 ATP-binding protein [Alphaproteobacteria bacterium]MEC9268868.1 ATP-binding protein [Pseudomonadota bacterium]